jgi:hypothetical protein
MEGAHTYVHAAHFMLKSTAESNEACCYLLFIHRDTTNQACLYHACTGWDEDIQPNNGVHAPHINRVPKFSNAYMLVYVRESDWSRIMAEPKEEDIDEGLRARFAVSEETFSRQNSARVLKCSTHALGCSVYGH